VTESRTWKRRARFFGPHSRLELYAKEVDGEFLVYALHRKGGSDQLARGLASAHTTKAAAMRRFEEMELAALLRGWKAATKRPVPLIKQAFDTIPEVE